MHCEIVGVQHYNGEEPTNWIYRGFHLRELIHLN
jgi:hypothetical protein